MSARSDGESLGKLFRRSVSQVMERLSSFHSEVGRQGSFVLGGSGGTHTYRVRNPLSGEEHASIDLPCKPHPTAADLLGALSEQKLMGRLLLGTKELMLDDRLPVDGEVTEIGLIKRNMIQVSEAGYYNGLYQEEEYRHENRPVYRMVQPDVEDVGERWIYYTSGSVPSGWKLNGEFDATKTGRGREGWDMLRDDYQEPDAPNLPNEIPFGKWKLNNGGTSPKPCAPLVGLPGRRPDRSDRAHLVRQATSEQARNDNHNVAAGCFNGDAEVQMADGSLKLARDVVVGDFLATVGGRATCVQACIVEARASQELVKLGNLFITPHHPVFEGGRWLRPGFAAGACVVKCNMELFNFVVADCEPIFVEGYMATSVGTFCEGLHDFNNPEHRTWGSDVIVGIYRQHPMWPNIISDSEQTMAAVRAAQAGDYPATWWTR